jgi:NAD(P)H-dependent FMN reductase
MGANVKYTGVYVPPFTPGLPASDARSRYSNFQFGKLDTFANDEADAVLIASPEYAHGVTGVMKNALDWAVSMPTFPGKPVALLNTSPRAMHAPAMLREILQTMSARLVPEASIALPLQGSGLALDGILARPDLVDALRGAVMALAAVA